MFQNLVKGDGDSAEKHREFYDEFLAVMDLTAEYYLQTIETVFLEHRLPKGEMRHRNRIVDPGKIRRVPLMTVEGEKDDISGVGQTLRCTNFVQQSPCLHAGTLSSSPEPAITAFSTVPAFGPRYCRKSANLWPSTSAERASSRVLSTSEPRRGHRSPAPVLVWGFRIERTIGRSREPSHA